jgi:hypothetical protein
MLAQRRVLRLRPCLGCDHFRASHYLLSISDRHHRRLVSRPRDRTTPMPCHVVKCDCSRFTADSQDVLCPVCSRAYAGRSSLEIHLYNQHPGLSTRERSLLLGGAIYPLGGDVNPWGEIVDSTLLNLPPAEA